MKQIFILIMSLMATTGYSQNDDLLQKVQDLEQRVNNLEEKMGKTYEQKLKDMEEQLHIGDPQDVKTVDGVTIKLMEAKGNQNNGELKIVFSLDNGGIDKNFSAKAMWFTDIHQKTYSQGGDFSTIGRFPPSNDQYNTLMKDTPCSFELTFKKIEYSSLMKGAVLVIRLDGNERKIQFKDIRISWDD